MNDFLKHIKHFTLIIFFSMLTLVLVACDLLETASYTTDDVLEQITIGYANNDDATHVTENIILVQSLEAFPSASITWESSKPDIISNQGEVNRPYEDDTVILIVNVRVGSVSKQRLFEVTVKGTSTELIDQSIVNDAIHLIDIIYQSGENAQSVTQDLILETTLQTFDSLTITWQSSNPDVISNQGVVQRPLIDTSVTLTVTINKNEITEEKSFDVLVIGTLVKSTYTIEIYYETFEEAIYELISTESINAYVHDEITLEIGLVDGFIPNHERTKSSGIVDEEGLLLHIYYDRLSYRIEFYEDDILVGFEEVKYGAQISEYPSLSKEGYIFVGWSLSPDGDTFDLESPIESSFELYPIWRIKTNYLPYYDGLTDAIGLELLAELNIILNQGVTMQTYGDARYILQESDRDPDVPGNIILVYRGTSVNATWDGGATWNREHVWPQSLLGVSTNNSSRHVGADLHNLKPANPSENSSRSNKYFDWTASSEAYVPRDEVKGDVARILFYMVAMYDYLELINGTPTTYKMAMLDTLIQWHELDPVDDFERNRNEVLYSYQNNRNPFIDHPELVDLIWGNLDLNQSQSQQTVLTMYNPMMIDRRKTYIFI